MLGALHLWLRCLCYISFSLVGPGFSPVLAKLVSQIVSGKFTGIVDLSSPGGTSVNDGINPDEFALQYITVDQVICLVSKFGKGALMAKSDVKAAYRNVPVHLSHHYLLGMKWHDQFYVDLGLPFGLRSAPFIFNSVADMVEWILVTSYQIPDLLKGYWFAGSWVPSQQQQSIAYKELFPVVIAAHIWGHVWIKRHVLFRSDNEAVVHILNTRTSKVPCLMRLLRNLLLSAARHSFSFSARHAPGVNNQIADALSRFHWQEFWRLVPDAQPLPTPIPPELLAELTSPP